MKNKIKFFLILGGAKLVMLRNADGADSFYAMASQALAGKKTDLKRIAAFLQNN